MRWPTACTAGIACRQRGAKATALTTTSTLKPLAPCLRMCTSRQCRRFGDIALHALAWLTFVQDDDYVPKNRSMLIDPDQVRHLHGIASWALTFVAAVCRVCQDVLEGAALLERFYYDMSLCLPRLISCILMRFASSHHNHVIDCVADARQPPRIC